MLNCKFSDRDEKNEIRFTGAWNPVGGGEADDGRYTPEMKTDLKS